jgi:hypothetical protein
MYLRILSVEGPFKVGNILTDHDTLIEACGCKGWSRDKYIRTWCAGDQNLPVFHIAFIYYTTPIVNGEATYTGTGNCNAAEVGYTTPSASTRSTRSSASASNHGAGGVEGAQRAGDAIMLVPKFGQAEEKG